MHPIESQLQNLLHRDDLMRQAAGRRQPHAHTSPASSRTQTERHVTRVLRRSAGAEQLRHIRDATRVPAGRVVRAVGGLRNGVG